MKNTAIKKLTALLLICAVLFSCSLIESFAATAEETAYKTQLRSAGFPELYLDKLWEMHQKYPNWVFEAYDTGLDWDAAVAAESAGQKNLVYIRPNTTASATRLYRSQSVGEYTSKGGFDYDYVIRDGNDSTQTGWTDATPMAVAYYMNPYTFIGSDVTIMQFESLEWNFQSVNEAEAIVETMLTGTFMSKTRNSNNTNYVDANGNITYKDSAGKTVTTSQTYANAIATAAQANNINPCYLTSKIIGEVSRSGSGSTTGTHGTYPGCYNYLNIGASDSSSGDAVTKGLARASREGWTTPMLSISGGASFIASSYIAIGQNTSYFQKFNVTKTNTYGHQYMTAVNGVANTTYSTYSGYKTYGILESKRTFYIPVFKNMPTASSPSVTLSGYTNQGVTTDAVTKRSDAGMDYTRVATVANGSSVTIYGGFRDQRVTYIPSFGTDSTYYRMYNPLWYKIDGGFVCEDYVEPLAAESLRVGQTLQFKYTVASGSEKPRFMSQDTRIATVDTNGVITAKGTGTTRVVAYLVNGSFAVIKLTVSNTASGVPSAVTSSTYSVNNSSSYISKIAVGTTVSSFTSKINESAYVRVTKNGTALSSGDLLTTGCVVSIMNGSQTVKAYTVVITGDIDINNGTADGKITITDLFAIRDELLSGTGRLSGANYKAADISGPNGVSDGKVTITDLFAIRDYLLGTSQITPQSY